MSVGCLVVYGRGVVDMLRPEAVSSVWLKCNNKVSHHGAKLTMFIENELSHT